MMWKKIINHKLYIKVGLKWSIGEGRKVRFWTNYWVT